MSASGAISLSIGQGDVDNDAALVLNGTLNSATVRFTAPGDIFMDQLPSVLGNRPGKTLAITSTNGGIFDNTAPDGPSDDTDVTAGALALSAATGIGTADDPLETVVSSLAFKNTAGAVSIRNSGALSITAVDGLTSSSNTGTTTSVTAVNVGGGMLTAAPGGVWVSFRTGMLGQTVLLRQQGLRAVKLPGAGSRHSLFTWAMGASTAYAAPSLYLVQSVSAVAGCVSPRTGHIRARGHVAGHHEADELLGSAQHGRVLYAAGTRGVFAIRPPAGCRAG